MKHYMYLIDYIYAYYPTCSFSSLSITQHFLKRGMLLPLPGKLHKLCLSFQFYTIIGVTYSIMLGYKYVCVCMWRSLVTVGCPLTCSLPKFSEAESLTEPGDH